MSIADKITELKNKAARLAIKAAAVTTMMTGAGAITGCSSPEENTNADETKDKIENTDKSKTSVVFRSKFGHYVNNVLLENGDKLNQNVLYDEGGAYLDTGDTVTYEGNAVKAVRYKDGAGKNVNFGKIGKMEKDITD